MSVKHEICSSSGAFLHWVLHVPFSTPLKCEIPFIQSAQDKLNGCLAMKQGNWVRRGTYIVLWRHPTREEEVGDGGEKQEASSDEQAHPPGADPAGVTLPELLFSSCRTRQWTLSHQIQQWTNFPALTLKVTLGRLKRANLYLNQVCPRPHRSAAWLSPAGSQWQARIQTLQTGWLQMTESSCWVSQVLLSYSGLLKIFTRVH